MTARIWRRADVLSSGVGAALGLLVAYYLLLTRVSTLHRLVSATMPPWYLPVMIVLVVVTAGLFGANFGLLTLLARARVNASAGIGSAGAALVGAFAAGCPACGAYLLTLLGVGAGLAVLPFGGLEVWALASLLMATTLSRSWGTLDAACLDGACPRLPDVSRRQTTAGLAVIATLMVALIGLFAAYG